MSAANEGRRVVLLAVVLMALSLRLWRLDAQELRGDEVFGYSLSLQPVSEIVEATLELQEPHPVASYVVAHFWLAWAGESEFALRFPGVWFGVLAVALVIRLARRLGMGEWSTLAAALLLAISPYTIWHSQDARMYAMSMALTVASSLFAWVWMKGAGWRAGAAYVGVTWLALHTHYYAVFVVVAQSLFMVMAALWGAQGWRRLWQWAGIQLLLLLLFAPWLLVARHILRGYHGNGDSPGLAEAMVRTVSAFFMGEAVRIGGQTWVALLAGSVVAAGAVGLWRWGKEGKQVALYLACYAVVPVLGTWLSALNRPIFDERYLVAAAPPVYLLAASTLCGFRVANRGVQVWRGASLLGAGLLVALLAVSMVGFFQVSTNPLLSKSRGWRELAQVVEQLPAGMDPGVVRIVQNYPDPTLWYYYQGRVEHLVLPPAAFDAAGAAHLVDGLVEAGVQRIILTVQPSPGWDGEAIAQETLAEAYQMVEAVEVGSWTVEVYSRAPEVLEPLAVDFANGIRLEGFAVNPEEPRAGGVLAVYLDWTLAGTELSGSETVFVQLLDANGVLAAQEDRLLISGGAIAVESPQGYGILVPLSLGAGEYQLIAGLYDPQKPGSPRILTVDGRDHVVLGQIAVSQP